MRKTLLVIGLVVLFTVPALAGDIQQPPAPDASVIARIVALLFP